MKGFCVKIRVQSTMLGCSRNCYVMSCNPAYSLQYNLIYAFYVKIRFTVHGDEKVPSYRRTAVQS